jgi:putative transcriptional regulator
MKQKRVYHSIIKGLHQAVDYEKGKSVQGLKRKKVSIAPVEHFKSLRIRQIRNKLNLSQATFAAILGVSPKTIEAWESGRNVPQGPAQRILWLLEKDNTIIRKYRIIEG